MNLSSYVQQVIDSTKEVNPAEITKLVLEGLNPEDYLSALEITLPAYVSTRINMNSRILRSGPSNEDEETPSYEFKPAAPRKPVIGAHSSVKIATWWDKMLNSAFYVDGFQWKQFGDCTYDELMIAYDKRSARARNTQDEADRIFKVAQVIKENNCENVRGLNPDQFLDAYGSKVL